MSLFNNYSEEEQARITTEYAPNGKLLKQKRNTTSGLFKYFLGTSNEQRKLIDTLNSMFDGLFPKQNTSLLEYHEKDLGIPDNIFSGIGTIEERQIDVIVKKYMMRGNRLQDFLDIADIYGISVTITTGLQTAIFPLNFPLNFASSAVEQRNTLYISITEDSDFIFPLPFPIGFSATSNVAKIKKIFNHIKPATTQIIYQEN